MDKKIEEGETLKKDLFLLKQAFDRVVDSLQESAQKFEKTNEESDKNMLELKVTTTKFLTHFNSFKNLETCAHETLVNEAKKAFKTIQVCFNDKLDLATETSLKKVRQEMERAYQELNSITQGRIRRRIGFTFAFCGGLLVSCLGIGSLLVYKAYHFIPTELQTEAHAGKVIQKVWPKLSKRSQDEINQAVKRL